MPATRRARPVVDVDEAHAAHADRTHARVVTEARDVDAGLLAGLDDQRAGRGSTGVPLTVIEMGSDTRGRPSRRRPYECGTLHGHRDLDRATDIRLESSLKRITAEATGVVAD